MLKQKLPTQWPHLISYNSHNCLNDYFLAGVWFMRNWADFLFWVFGFSLSFGHFGFWVLLRMMSMTCHSLEGRAVLDLVACGCSSNALLDRCSVRNYTKASSKGICRGYGARQLGCGRRDRIRCGVSSMKTAETPVPKKTAETLLNSKTRVWFWFEVEVLVNWM